jgi:hypothetical protein
MWRQSQHHKLVIVGDVDLTLSFMSGIVAPPPSLPCRLLLACSRRWRKSVLATLKACDVPHLDPNAPW